MPEHKLLNQAELEKAIKAESPQKAFEIDELEHEKIGLDEQPILANNASLPESVLNHDYYERSRSFEEVNGKIRVRKHSHIKGESGSRPKEQGEDSISPQERRGLGDIQEGLAEYPEYTADKEVTAKGIESEEIRFEPTKLGEIQADVWQARVNEAFQRGDYEAIKTLERVIPQAHPSVEFVQAKVHELVATRGSKWIEDLSHIRSVADIDPNDPAIVAEFDKLLGKLGTDKDVSAQLTEFKKATGVVPSTEVVQGKYRDIIGGGFSNTTQDLVRDIRELTGISPDRIILDEVIDQGNLSRAKEVAPIFGVEITVEMAQRAFASKLEREGGLYANAIAGSGFLPSEETVQQAYGKIISTAERGSEWLRQAQELKRATRVIPQFTPEQLEPLYKKYLSRGLYRESLEDIEQLVGITGIPPVPELVQQAAVHDIEQNLQDPKRLQANLSRLELMTGVKVEIPPEQIQASYQKAIAKKDALALLGLASVLGVKPEVDPETARQFMVSYIDRPNNPIQALQKVFGVEFHAKPEEVAAKYEENFEKLNFSGIDAIREITGAVPDRDRIVRAVREFAEKKFFAEPPSGYQSSSDYWRDSIKQTLDKYQVAIPAEQITSFYEQCIEARVDTQKLAQLNSFFGTNISPELAQRVYQRIMSDNQQTLLAPGSTLESVYQLSGGIKPELPEDQVQVFYTHCLAGSNIDTGSIEKVSAITGIDPHFDPQAINNIYRESLLSGNAYRIKKIKEFTGIEFVVDDETRQLASQAVDQQLAGIVEKDFSWHNSDAENIRKIIQAIGVVPSSEAMQAYYRSLLVFSPENWSQKIDKLVAATGISPDFTPDEIRERAEQLLKAGQSANLEGLSKYGVITLGQEAATDGYQALFGSIKNEDGGYSKEWLENFKRVQAATGTPPTREQIAQVIINLRKDEHYVGYVGSTYSPTGKAIEIAESTFGTRIQANTKLIGQIYASVFQDGDLREIDNLQAKTGIRPIIPLEVVQPRVDAAFKSGHIAYLVEIKRSLGVEKLPVSNDVAQEMYRQLAENSDLGNKYRSEEVTKKFYQIFELTGVQAQLTPEQLSRGYRNTLWASHDGNYGEFEKVVSVPPTKEDLQYRVYAWLADRPGDNKDRILKFMKTHDLKISDDMAARAVIRHLSKTNLSGGISGFLETAKKIADIRGGNIAIPAEQLVEPVSNILNTHSTEPYSSSNNVLDLFNWFEVSTGVPPPQSLIDQAYTLTFRQKYAETTGENSAGTGWNLLRDKSGLPSPGLMQKMYVQQLFADNNWSLGNNIAYMRGFSNIVPDMGQMTQIAREQGVLHTGETIKTQIQRIYRDRLISGNVTDVGVLEKGLGNNFHIDEGDLQVVYASVLMGDTKNQREVLKFLTDNTGVLPSLEIIQARYKELFAGDRFRAEYVADFQDIVKTPPSNEVLQAKYKELFEEYVRTYEPAYYEEDFDDNGERFLEQITILSQGTGISLQLDREFVMSMYEYSVSHGKSYHPKLAVIAQQTGVEIDRDFIQKRILDNKNFSAEVPFAITSEQLDEYFSNPEHRSLAEYKRVYSIFGCYDYYQKVLTSLQEAGTIDSKKQTVEILTAMGLRSMDNTQQYSQIKARILELGREDNRVLDKTVALALSELAKNGDGEITNHLIDILRKRSTGKGQNETRRTIGFTEEQEIALRTLMQLDNPLANEALFSLVFTSDINSRVKVRIARNLADTKKDFFPKNMTTWIKDSLENRSGAFNWDDFQFFQATLRIPSADLRIRSRKEIDDAFGMFTKDGRPITETHQKICPSVPENTFMQLWKFTRGDEKLAAKFNNLYSVTKSATHQDALLFGIVNALSVNTQVQAKIVDQLDRIDFVSKDGAEQMAKMLKTVAFLDTVERKLHQGGNSQIFSILDRPVESLDQLNTSLKAVVVEKIKEVLPNDAIDADKIQILWEQWGNLEPLFVYAGKMRSSGNTGTLNLVAEMVPYMDAPAYEEWKAWRYNPLDKRVKKQIGHLSGRQLEIWRDDHFAELGDIMIAVSPTDRPRQVLSHLEDAIREGHIYNPNVHASDTHQFIQEHLANTFEQVATQPNQRAQIFAQQIQALRADMGVIDNITRYANTSRIQQSLALFSGEQIPINKKTIDAINFVDQFLPQEAAKELQDAYVSAEKQEKKTVEAQELVPENVKSALRQTVQQLESAYATTEASDIFERYGLDKTQMKNLGQFYQKRQELQAILDLYRLSTLTPRLIATNKIEEREDKKGEAVTQVVDRLRKYFKDNLTFLQDVENIQSTIVQKEDLGANRRLAMLVTDNPQMLFQVGKYPTGCGSCQNYEGSPELNKSLAGYVADAHIKAAFLIDINKLSPSTKNDIETQGFEQAKTSIHPRELLEASVARSMMKLVTTQNGRPVLFIEPTYTQINKGDLSMNKFFDIFAELVLTDTMGIQLARGGGNTIVEVPESKNPSGQYEDAAVGNAGNGGMGILVGTYTMPAQFITKFTPVSKEDRILAERISQGSQNYPYSAVA